MMIQGREIYFAQLLARFVRLLGPCRTFGVQTVGCSGGSRISGEGGWRAWGGVSPPHWGEVWKFQNFLGGA